MQTHSEPPTAYLVVGHGTRQPAGVAQAIEVAGQMSRLLWPACVEIGFLELASPTIDDAVAKLAVKSIESFVTLPILLFSAGHAEHDIPVAVGQAASKYGLRSLAQSPPLDDHPAIVRLSADRFHEALSSAGLANTTKSIGLAMIGRGSKSPRAHQAMLRFTELRRQWTNVGWCQTGFITGQSPNVAETLNQLESSDCEVLVVQPHLFFEGELIANLRREAARRQKSSSRPWIVTGTLGADERLAEALAELARQTSKDLSVSAPSA